MMLFRAVALATLGLAAVAQVKPKDKAEQYPATLKLGKVTIGAENWGHGFSSEWGSFAADDFIVVEVAVYSENNQHVSLSSGQFTLRLNHKTTLLTQAPGMVSASIKYPDWEQKPQLTGDVGSGPVDVILGRQRPVERFPGDRRPQDGRPSGPIPRAPEPDDPSGAKRQKGPTIDEIVSRVAVGSGEVAPPAAGYLFFAYRGKLKSLKSVELVYEGPAGSASVVLP